MENNKTMFQLANMILRDECPPDNTLYLCRMGEEDECRCEECWSNYLLWAVNGYRKQDKPYRQERRYEFGGIY